jgi:hypothetical protein
MILLVRCVICRPNLYLEVPSAIGTLEGLYLSLLLDGLHCSQFGILFGICCI